MYLPAKEKRNAAAKQQRCRKRLLRLTSTEHASILVKTTSFPLGKLKLNDVHPMEDIKIMKKCSAQRTAVLVDIRVFCVTHGVGFSRNLKVVSRWMGDVCLANGGICRVEGLCCLRCFGWMLHWTEPWRESHVELRRVNPTYILSDPAVFWTWPCQSVLSADK